MTINNQILAASTTACQATSTPEEALDLLALVAANMAYVYGGDPHTRAICMRLIREIRPRKPWLESPCPSSPTSDPA